MALGVSISVFRQLSEGKEVSCIANQTKSLAHTKWMCKYHIVFTPKCRRKATYNQYRADLRDVIKALCKYKGVEIFRRKHDAGSCSSAIEYTTKDECVKLYGILKREACKFEVQVRESTFLGRGGYYVSTVWVNEATIKKYIDDQDKHDIDLDKLSVKEYEDHFEQLPNC